MLLTLIIVAATITLQAQSNEWTWMNGSNVLSNNCITNTQGTFCGQVGVYGTEGTAAAANHPGGTYYPVTWVGKDGSLWLFGGYEMDSTGLYGLIDTLWKYDPVSGQWAWMAGSKHYTSFCDTNFGCVIANYGTKGQAAATNTPGARYGGYSWTDANGNLWYFGGTSYIVANNTTTGFNNDLWEFDITLNQWIWMGGSSTVDQRGVAGTQGVASTSNIPGARVTGQSWTDSNGKLWLFGGVGYDVNGCEGYMDDLWQFDPVALTWTWENGQTMFTACAGLQVSPASYGTKGVAAASNQPGGRSWVQGWSDGLGNLWLYGGNYILPSSANAHPGDLWQYNTGTNEWTWMNGTNTLDANNGVVYVESGLGNYASGNTPGSRLTSVGALSNGKDGFIFSGETENAYYCDQWSYDPGTNEWAWVSGGFTSCAPAYGTLGQASAANYPGYRYISTTWSDASGNVWLFGGYGADSTGTSGLLNDLWKYGSAAAAVTPTISWNPASPITNPAPLSASQFNASAMNGGTNISTDGTFVYYVGPVAGGVVATTSTVLPVGNDQLCVEWTPGNAYAAQYTSTSACATIVVNPAISATSTTLTSSVNPVFITNSITLTAVVTSNTGTPAGNVTFSLQAPGAAQATTLATVALDATGKATYQTTLSTAGANILTAVYAGNASFATSTSSTLNVEASDFALSSTTVTPVMMSRSSTAQYILTVAPVAPATTLPQEVALSFSGMPTGVTVSASPATVKAGSGSTQVTVTLSASAQAYAPAGGRPGAPGLALALTGFSLPLLALFRRRRKKINSWLVMLVLALMTGALGIGVTGCGSQHQAVQGSIVINAASGNLSHTNSFSLTVK